MKQIFFLSGLPRSGSTVLGSILGQNPDITVTPTSPFLDLLCYANEALNKASEQYTFNLDLVSKNIYQSIYEGFYKQFTTKYVIDKHRGHPKNINPWRNLIGIEPKIICTVRPIAEVLVSFLMLIQKYPSNNFVDEFLHENNITINTANRAKCLWERFIFDPYQSMSIGIQNHRECIHIVEYDALVGQSSSVLSGIYNFLEIEPFAHNVLSIKNVCAEDKDTAWGVPGLHDIRSVLNKKSIAPKEVLGEYLTDFYNQYNLIF